MPRARSRPPQNQTSSQYSAGQNIQNTIGVGIPGIPLGNLPTGAIGAAQEQAFREEIDIPRHMAVPHNYMPISIDTIRDTVRYLVTQPDDSYNYGRRNWNARVEYNNPIHMRDAYNDVARELRFEYLEKKNNTVTIDKRTMGVIVDITNEIIESYKVKYIEILKKRIDITQRGLYNDLFNELNGDSEAHEAVAMLNNLPKELEELVKGNEINSRLHLLPIVEAKAYIRYDIEHSKYKYYPRLKQTVNYGDSELLASILTVTQIGKGKVICQ